MVDDLEGGLLFDVMPLLELAALVIVGCTELCTFFFPKQTPVHKQ
jgi:hypothetical protein